MAAFVFPQSSSSQRGASCLRDGAVARVGIGHALVDNCCAEEVCRSIIKHASDRRDPAYVITPNAQHIVLLDEDERFRAIYQRADLVLPDGVSLLLAAKLNGRSLKERVPGVEIFCTICRQAAEQGLKVFLLGGRAGSAELAASALRANYPSLDYETYCPPFGFEHSEEGLKAVADAITVAKPHIVFVGLGAPKQEFWIHQHGLKLEVPVFLGVGGSFEIVGGVVPRAPVWVQGLACEWLYRLCREPRRMWRRYLIGNAQFMSIILRQQVRRAFLKLLLRMATDGRFGAELEEMSQKERDHLASLSSTASLSTLVQ